MRQTPPPAGNDRPSGEFSSGEGANDSDGERDRPAGDWSPDGGKGWRGGGAGWSSAIRLAGAGLELAGSTLVFGAAGYWVDWIRDHGTPYVALVGLLVGFAVGLYRLISLAMKMLEDEESPRD